jgi:hypothetical protein
MTRTALSAALLVLALAEPACFAGEPLGGVTAPTLLAPECKAIPYVPVPVYLHANGVRLGTLKLDRPELAKADADSCDARPRVMLHMRGAPAPVPVELTEVGYEDYALTAYTVLDIPAGRWVRGRAGSQHFWVPVSAGSKLLTFAEDLVQGVSRFDEVCAAPGQCMQAPDSFLREAETVGKQRQDSCYGSAYDLVETARGADGRLYYRLELPKEGGQAPRLPASLWVPAQSADGKWTGFFYPRGC